MSSLLLLLAALCALCAAFLLGKSLCWYVLQKRTSNASQRLTLEEALADPVFLFVLLLAVCGLVAVALGPWFAVPCALACWFSARKAPAYIAKRKSEELRIACESELDVLCDIVAMGIEAGLSFDAALELYCQRFDGALAREMRGAHVQWTRGIVSRKSALYKLAERLDSAAFRRFAQTVAQALEHGSPIVKMLRRLAMDLRQARKVLIERQVAKAPVKMLVPTGVCILPAMMLVVMGPMILQFMKT